MTKKSDGSVTSAFPMPAIHRRDLLALGAGGLLAASGVGSARAQSRPAPPPPWHACAQPTSCSASTAPPAARAGRASALGGSGERR